MEGKQKSKRDDAQPTSSTIYLKFYCDSVANCKNLKVSLEEILPHPIDFIFDRDPKMFLFSQSGFLRTIGIETSFGPLSVEGINIRFTQVSEETFLNQNSNTIPLICFQSLNKFTKEKFLITYFSKFGEVQSLELTGFSQDKHGQTNAQGYVTYYSAIDTERFLLNFSAKPSDLKIISLSTPKQVQQVQIHSKHGSAYVPKEQLGFQLKVPKLDMQPKLDFTKHKSILTRDHAFGGFFIRPYLKSASTIALNSAVGHNVRFNLVRPQSLSNLRGSGQSKSTPLKLQEVFRQ